MPADLDITNVRGFQELSKRFKAAGLEGKGLRRNLSKQINKETKPARMKAKANARTMLPKRGGLARRVAATTLTTSARFTGPGVGVRIQGKGKAGARSVKRIDEGVVTHPVYGRRKRWVTQQVKPGWFTKAMEDSAPRMRHAVVEAVNSTLRGI